jgi:glycosyltransferase involved in cell wall biosynthesis
MDLGRVAAEVLKKKPDTVFLLAGEGELRLELEAWCKDQDILSQMYFLGWCQRSDDIRNILDSSNCFLMTSLWEGLPRALVEAMAARRPAVAYAVDGVRDILVDNENGFLIPPGDVALAAEKILWLANHPMEAMHMGTAGHKRVQKEFDIDTMVRHQEKLYEELYEKVPLKPYYESLWSS